MTDGVIKSTGNSRYLKSVANLLSLAPTWPDAVELLVSGSFPVDFNGINPDGWNTQGTPLNKANLLSDSAGALYGYANGTGTINGVLGVLGPYYQYWWKRTAVNFGTSTKTQLASMIQSNTSTYIWYSDSIKVESGDIILDNRQTLTLTFNSSAADLAVLTGKYVAKYGTQAVLYCDGSPSVSVSGTTKFFYANTRPITFGSSSYVKSASKSAYPDLTFSLVPPASGYYYISMGKPLDVLSAKYIQVGEITPTTAGFTVNSTGIPKILMLFNKNTIEGFPIVFVECFSGSMFYYSKSSGTFAHTSCDIIGRTIKYWTGEFNNQAMVYVLISAPE